MDKTLLVLLQSTPIMTCKQTRKRPTKCRAVRRSVSTDESASTYSGNKYASGHGSLSNSTEYELLAPTPAEQKRHV